MTASAKREATFQRLGLHCEICDGMAVAMVQDFVRINRPESHFTEHERDGDAHFFCRAHQRPSRTRDVFEDGVPVKPAGGEAG